eukprot:CAMPEP_0181397682 /NCGR_PEP_ID=MMETSP1110-20121109/621_1 /TAXON_ID=174948 /ORGANISM="Symbiodinium sp., Strain CCMP421" /LENGTH=140 /DNA_ID=CAMNT_0023519549 /DNA_START=420 /DNA_END=839 /DNA_ORIENTATION=+
MHSAHQNVTRVFQSLPKPGHDLLLLGIVWRDDGNVARRAASVQQNFAGFQNQFCLSTVLQGSFALHERARPLAAPPLHGESEALRRLAVHEEHVLRPQARQLWPVGHRDTILELGVVELSGWEFPDGGVHPVLHVQQGVG